MCVIIRLSGNEFIEVSQNKIFDAFQALSPRSYQTVPVRIIDIDDESLLRLGPWPWPRTKMAEIISNLSKLGASTIVFDITFSEPDATSPEQIARRIPSSPELKALKAKLEKLPRHDHILAQAMAKSKVITGFPLLIYKTETRPLLKAGLAYSGDSPLSYLPGFSGALANSRALEEASLGNGSLSILPEKDGITRRIPLLFRYEKDVYPSIVLEAARVHQEESGYVVKSAGARGVFNFGQHTGINQIKVGPQIIPTDSQGRAWLHYTREVPERSIPAWKLLSGDVSRALIAGHIVFLGTSAVRLRDTRTTPLNPSCPGVEILAQMTEQILLGHFLQRPDWADGVELAALLILGLGLIWLLPRLGALWSGLIGLGAIALTFPLSWYAFSKFHLLLDPLFPSLAALLVYLSSSLASYWQSETERRRLVLFDQLKDELVAMVSHDLRGPVNAMVTAVTLLSRESAGPLTDSQKRILELIKQSGAKLNSFVANILDAAKIKAGKMQYHFAPLQGADAARSALELFRFAAQAKSIALEDEIPGRLPPVAADREKFEQVLNNLLGNALKFTPSGGKISVLAEAQPGLVRFSVRDTGPGMAPENLSKLFRKFEQFDLAAQRERGVSGTGLGLSICRSVIEAHGGRIWAESEPGKGSTFHFTIPQAQA
ncbi:MAG: CHASE2 domain-containing protein [Elusimicrobia bacterium]|nr:CHASE2 domain-containing protein [Elusimicrobiota bacterium]